MHIDIILSMKEISVPVTFLANFVSRAGDLVSTGYESVSGIEGTRLHRKIFSDLSKQYGDDMETEVSLSATYETGELSLLVSGRADVLLQEEDRTLRIIEIKSFNSSKNSFEKLMRPEHVTQLELYGAMYLMQNTDIDMLKLTLRYVSITSLEAYEDTFTIVSEEAEGIFNNYCASYAEFALSLISYREQMLISVRSMDFPYENIRRGQAALMKTVLSSLSCKEALFSLAPTGTGKTISTLYPALKGLLRGNYNKIFYLTAKTATRGVAAKALNDMREKGLKIKSITLASKENMCPFEGRCDAANCSLAKNYYSRLRPALSEILENDEIDPALVGKVAMKHKICPHELSLDVMNYCTVVIGDYNHAFDPRVMLIRGFEGEASTNNAVLVDEAHNLVDRAREMYSATLPYDLLKRLMKEFKGIDPKAEAMLFRVDSYYRICEQCSLTERSSFVINEGVDEKKILKTSGWEGMRDIPRKLYEVLWKAVRLLQPHLESLPKGDLRDVTFEFFFEARHFLNIIERYYNDAYITSCYTDRGDIAIKLVCLDSSSMLNDLICDNFPIVFFSATLSPYEYYKNVLLGKDADYTRSLELPSPFPPENLDIMIDTDISTSYKNRAVTAPALSDRILCELEDRRGNYMVFFPSFEYMNDIMKRITEVIGDEPGYKIILQKPNMTASEKEEFLKCYEEPYNGCLIGAAVLGGHFGEGIDLVGDRLSGVVIVGVGIPKVTPERQILSNYYSEKFGDGFAFAYRFPGWEKVLQAVGRVIRTEEDTGFALLIDERLSQPEYLTLFPENWKI